jgi:hypothetical protein
VRFGDMADPRTVAAVDPANLAASFGDGVALSRVSVEITTDPVTRGIEKKLGWLPAVKVGSLDGKRIQFLDQRKTLANTLHYGDFKWGSANEH